MTHWRGRCYVAEVFASPHLENAMQLQSSLFASRPVPPDRDRSCVYLIARMRIVDLLSSAQLGTTRREVFEEARLALECLPLTTGEFATATNRLASARTDLRPASRAPPALSCGCCRAVWSQ